MAKGKKTGGRVRGTPNKLTKEIRVALKNIMAEQIELIPEMLKGLEPIEKLEIIIKLMPYVFPKIQNAYYNIGEPMNLDPFDNL